MRLLLSLLFLAHLAHSADFPALYNSEPGNPSPMSPQEALKALKLPDGFKATLFAAEPDVQNPIAMAWDTRGRLWVAEHYPYPERAKPFYPPAKGRVITVEDKNWGGNGGGSSSWHTLCAPTLCASACAPSCHFRNARLLDAFSPHSAPLQRKVAVLLLVSVHSVPTSIKHSARG